MSSEVMRAFSATLAKTGGYPRKTAGLPNSADRRNCFAMRGRPPSSHRTGSISIWQSAAESSDAVADPDYHRAEAVENRDKLKSNASSAETGRITSPRDLRIAGFLSI